MTAKPRVTVGIPTFNRARLLRESMASVLSQSYEDLTLLICDNASDDETPEAVASFVDPRIEYVRSERNIGMTANYNRVLELARSDYLLILPDDDLLYPDHIRLTVDVLERHRNVGLVHTAFDSFDGASRVIHRGRSLVEAEGLVTTESGDEYLDRAMRSSWTICWASALFRRRAIADAEGIRIKEEPMGDIPLFMRIACRWDLAFVSRPLAGFRIHANAATAAIGSYNGVGYDLLDTQPRILYDHRRRFLAEASLPEERVRRYRAVAEDTFRRDTIEALAIRAGAGMRWTETWRAIARLASDDPHLLLLPGTLKLCAAQLGGRRAKRAVQRLRRSRAKIREPERVPPTTAQLPEPPEGVGQKL